MAKKRVQSHIIVSEEANSYSDDDDSSVAKDLGECKYRPNRTRSFDSSDDDCKGDFKRNLLPFNFGNDAEEAQKDMEVLNNLLCIRKEDKAKVESDGPRHAYDDDPPSLLSNNDELLAVELARYIQNRHSNSISRRIEQEQV